MEQEDEECEEYEDEDFVTVGSEFPVSVSESAKSQYLVELRPFNEISITVLYVCIYIYYIYIERERAALGEHSRKSSSLFAIGLQVRVQSNRRPD